LRRINRKPVHQFVATPKKINLSHNKFAAYGGNSILHSKNNKSSTITNNSVSTAPASGLFKSNGFDIQNRISIAQKIEQGHLPSVLDKSVKVAPSEKRNFQSFSN
jgi:hypothetical protein